MNESAASITNVSDGLYLDHGDKLELPAAPPRLAMAHQVLVLLTFEGKFVRFDTNADWVTQKFFRHFKSSEGIVVDNITA